MMTVGVNALAAQEKAGVLEKVRTFTAFNDGNDPYAEHDFGSFDHQGVTYAFKIDYFDSQLRCGSPDPTDPSVTTRVMTIMRLDEW
jgi:Protein of unknown function (DUF3768)